MMSKKLSRDEIGFRIFLVVVTLIVGGALIYAGYAQAWIDGVQRECASQGAVAVRTFGGDGYACVPEDVLR